jgi:hypothetical protein
MRTFVRWVATYSSATLGSGCKCTLSIEQSRSLDCLAVALWLEEH